MILVQTLLLCGLLSLAGTAPTDSSPAEDTGGLLVTVEYTSPDGDILRLPGARLVLLTPDRRETSRTETDPEGTGTLTGLPPGEYILRVELAGFRPLLARVAIAAGLTTMRRLQLTLAGPANEVHVPGYTAEGVTQAVVPEVIQQQLLRNIPLLNEQFLDVLPLLPGIVRSPDGQLNMKGARSSQSGLLVNSVNVTDPVTGQFAMEVPMEAIESMEVYLNPYSAEFGKFTGAITTIETRSGTNRWQFLVTGFVPRPRWRDGNISGIKSFTPRLSLSGPLVKDRVWFSLNGQYRFIRNEVYSLPDPDNEVILESIDTFNRIDWQINPDHRFRVAFSRYPQTVSYVNLDTFHPREVTANFRQRGFFLAFSEQTVINLNSVLETTFSIKDYDAYIWANSPGEMNVTPEGWSGGYFNRQERFSRRYELIQKYSAAPFRWRGIHLAKAGYTFAYARYQSQDSSRPVNIERADGSLSQRIEFFGSPDIADDITEITTFVQDSWQMKDWLVLDLGLRLDWDSLSRELHFAPRLGFVVLPIPGDNRSIVRGGLGLFYDKIPLIAGVFPQYQRMQVTRYGPADDNVPIETVRFRNEILDDTLRNPYSLTWNIEADRRLFDRMIFRVGYLHRNQRKDLLLNVTDGDDPRLVLTNSGKSDYREWLFSFKYNLPGASECTLSYVRSSSRGNLNHYQSFLGNYHQPVIRGDEYGPQPYDVPNRFLFGGVFHFPWKLTVSPFIEFRDGFPYSVVDEDQDFVGARNRGGRFPRFLAADVQLSRMVSVPFRGRKYNIRFILGIFNLTNHWNPRDVQNNVDSVSFGGFYNSVGRKVRFKVEFDF
jgi:hypothetical protein